MNQCGTMWTGRTQSNVPEPCMKKSTAAIIMVEPTMLDDTIVINLTHKSVITANMMAPPPTATAISRMPNRWLGSVATQNVMIEPLVMAPAKAHTSTAAMGCVEPSTAPNRPVTIASAAQNIRRRLTQFSHLWIISNVNPYTYRNRLDCQSKRSLDFATKKCILRRPPDRSENQQHADIGSQVLHKRFQKRQLLSKAELKLFRAESMRMTDFPLHSIVASRNKNGMQMILNIFACCIRCEAALYSPELKMAKRIFDQFSDRTSHTLHEFLGVAWNAFEWNLNISIRRMKEWSWCFRFVFRLDATAKFLSSTRAYALISIRGFSFSFTYLLVVRSE